MPTTTDAATTTSSSHDAMQAAWELIQPEEDWRAPVDKWIHSRDFAAARDACSYFTATVLQVVAKSAGGTLVHVRADGYRMGPAGP